MDIGMMIEGQNGLTWERWSHVLALAERLKFASIFRSDHYFIGGQKNSLDLFLSFVVAARETTNIRFGSLVSPVTFRSPVDVGRMAAQIENLASGRFTLGIGAGWNEPEHRAYGIPFPPVGERMDRLQEAIAVLKALWSDGPATFDGSYYRLEGADCLPKPRAHLPLLIGGSGERRTLRLVAEHADEWNSINTTPENFARKNGILQQHCDAVGRDSSTIRRSMMAFGFVGPAAASIERLLRSFFRDEQSTVAELTTRARDRGMMVGETQQIIDLLGDLEAAGVQEVEFQHFDFDDDELPEFIAAEIALRV